MDNSESEQMDGQTGRQTDRRTDGQTDRFTLLFKKYGSF